MSFRSDSLFHRLSDPQRDELMMAMMEAKTDRADAGLELCKKWDVKASRTGVHDFFARYNFGWRLERGAWVAKTTEGMSQFEEEKRRIVSQKLFAAATDADCDPKLLILIRALELDQDKIKQKDAALEHNKERFRESLRSKLEAGMNALFEQIKDNPKALAAFEAMKGALAK